MDKLGDQEEDDFLQSNGSGENNEDEELSQADQNNLENMDDEDEQNFDEEEEDLSLSPQGIRNNVVDPALVMNNNQNNDEQINEFENQINEPADDLIDDDSFVDFDAEDEPPSNLEISGLRSENKGIEQMEQQTPYK